MQTQKPAMVWLVAAVVVVALIALLRDALLPFAVGAVLAYFLNPLADGLERLGLGRTLASGIVVGLAAIAVVATVFFLAPLVFAQLRQLAATLPADLDRLRLGLEAWAATHFGASLPGVKASIERAASELSAGTAGIVSGLASMLWSRSAQLFGLVSLLLITPLVTFYLLRDWHSMLARIDDWLPRDEAPTIRRLAADIDRAVGAFIRGQGTICILLGMFYALLLSAAGLRYGLVVGLATGILAFVPMVGWLLGLAVALVLALTQGWPDPALAMWVFGIYAAGMVLDSALLSPMIVGQKVGLHPVWLMLALFVFSALFGGLGVIVAVPVAAAVAVLVRFARDRYLASDIYQGRAAGPPT